MSILLTTLLFMGRKEMEERLFCTINRTDTSLVPQKLAVG